MFVWVRIDLNCARTSEAIDVPQSPRGGGGMRNPVFIQATTYTTRLPGVAIAVPYTPATDRQDRAEVDANLFRSRSCLHVPL